MVTRPENHPARFSIGTSTHCGNHGASSSAGWLVCSCPSAAWSELEEIFGLSVFDGDGAPSPSKTDSPNISSSSDQAADGQEQTSQPADEEAPWLPQWVEVPIENLAGWFSGLVTIRKNIPDHPNQTPEAGENISR